jgi:hypothetical protein
MLLIYALPTVTSILHIPQFMDSVSASGESSDSLFHEKIKEKNGRICEGFGLP